MKKNLALIVLVVFYSLSNAQELSQWRGPNRNGVFNESGLLSKWPDAGPGLIWHYDGLGEGYSSAAVTASGIFTTGMINGSGYVFALSREGKLIWKKEYGKEWNISWNGTRSTPLVVKDKLYVLSSFGKLVCMNTSDGEILWEVDFLRQYDGRNIEWGITENILMDGNTIYCTPGGIAANVVALDRNSGKIKWKSKGNSEKSAYCSPLLISLSERKIIVTMMEKSIQGLDAATGEFLWKHPQPNQYSVHPNIPVYSDGFIYATSGYGQGGVMLKLASDGRSVTEIWREKSLDPRMGGVVELNGRIYGAGDRSRMLVCLDWKTGKVVYSIRQMAPANIIANAGLLYIYSESGKVSLVQPNAEMFNTISSFTVPYGNGPHWAHLVINDKKLYVRHGSSLMVYDLSSN